MKGASVMVIAALVVVAVAVRVVALGAEGHEGDVRVMARWAERMAEVGPWRFYEGAESVYPALLYPLWLVGLALDGEALAQAIKSLSIPFDVAIGILLFGLLRRSGSAVAIGASVLYLLNPAVVIGGSIWGQVDSAGTLAYLASLVALSSSRHGTAGFLAALGGMLKPQFGLVALVVLTVAGLERRRHRTWRPLVRSAVGMASAYLLIAVPLGLHPLRYASLLESTATLQPETSLHAFNPWGLVVGFGVPDDRYVVAGALLLVAGLAGALLGLRRFPDAAVLLGVGAVIVLAFYFLPTRAHERYLFPTMALCVPFALAGWREAAAYVGLSSGFALSLLYALHQTTAFTVPMPWAAWLTSTAGVWTIGTVLMASAAGWAWMLVVRRPRWPAPPPGPTA